MEPLSKRRLSLHHKIKYLYLKEKQTFFQSIHFTWAFNSWPRTVWYTFSPILSKKSLTLFSRAPCFSSHSLFVKTRRPGGGGVLPLQGPSGGSFCFFRAVWRNHGSPSKISNYFCWNWLYWGWSALPFISLCACIIFSLTRTIFFSLLFVPAWFGEAAVFIA